MSLYSAGVEYGIHCLLFLIGEGGESRDSSVRDLAELQGVPQEYLAKVFTKLARAGVGGRHRRRARWFPPGATGG